jgi:hypothetical protein
MRVFEFSYDVDYGGGIMLIGAVDLDRAMEIVSQIPTGFGRWVFNYEHTDLVYTGKSEGEILSQSYAE